MKGLTPEQKAQYDRDGYTILKSVLFQSGVRGVRRAHDGTSLGTEDNGGFRSPRTRQLGSHQ